jgi:hypothetical protein
MARLHNTNVTFRLICPESVTYDNSKTQKTTQEYLYAIESRSIKTEISKAFRYYFDSSAIAKL